MMQGCRHTLAILKEYAWSMARVCLHYGKSMPKVCLDYASGMKFALRFAAVLMVMIVGIGVQSVKAADYVLTYTTGGTTYYVARNGTTGVQRVSAFDPTTCIWSCSSNTDGTTAGTLNNSNTYGYLYQMVNGTRYFLGAPDADLALATNVPNNYYRWRTNGTYVYNRYSNNTSYYINLANGVDRNTTANTASNARPYQVTTTTEASSSTSPTISGADVLTATGTSNYTATGAAYRVGYTNYRFNNADHYVDANNNSFTGTPAAASLGTATWSLSSNDYATVNNSGVITVNSLPSNDVTVTLTVTIPVTGGTPAAPSGTNLTSSKEITIQGTNPSAPIINISGTSVTMSTDATGTTSIRYTTDGTDPTTSTGTVYSGAIDLSGSTSSPVTIKAVTVRNGNVSAVTTETVTLTLPEPVITVNGSAGTATISATAGATIYYTTDGSTPTTSSTQYSSGISGLSMMTTIKAIAVMSGWNNSPVASETVTIPSGTDGGTVTLFDYEDHKWSYYSDPDCPIRSLSPADVKITYYGDGIVMSNNNDYTAGTNNYVSPGNTNYVGGAKVNVGGENENTFIYYKTLERGDATQSAWTFSSSNQSSAASRCPYTPIPNPFQVRPTYGSRGNTDANDFTGWRGFQCWRLKSVTGGAVYSAASGGTALTTGAVINAETEIYFAPNSEYGMEVELEAVWARAYLVKGNNANANAILNYGNLGVERNFMTLTTNESYRFNGTTGRRITNVDRAVTISCYYPSGEAPDNTGGSVTGNNNNITLSANTKFENVRINVGGNYITASGHDLIIGRGCTSSTAGTVYGNNANSNINQTVRIESGTYTNFYPIGTSGPGNNITKQHIILGCDYDRAKEDDSKIKITDYIKLIQTESHSTGTDKVIIFVKSGTYQDNQGTGTAENSNNCFYLWSPSQNTTGTGTRTMNVEGGKLWHIAGGLDCGNANNSNNLTIRVKGGTIRGSVFGGAARYDTKGYKTFIFTGGTVQGWIAGGSNGYLASGTYGSGTEHGTVDGRSYVYVGGSTHVGGREDAINMSIGGYVFGAGCGNTNANTNAGSVTDQTNVVIADKAYVKHGVYGGGAYGSSLGTANVYVLGNAIIDGDDDDVQDVIGGVYGGARQKGGGTVNITMNGGTINKGGLFGGSNATGTISGNVTMQIDGGQVGTPSTPANIHGGGYGQPTIVSQNVDITLGASGQTTGGVTVYGDVYGGSALGSVNGTAATTTYHTNVTLNKGTINGSLYGGALGDNSTAANVYGPVTVTVNGGSVKKTDSNGANGSGAVYGCNNINGAPQRAVAVVINGTDPAPAADQYALFAVYGGGNKANYSYGTPTVTVNNCDNSIEYVYGGGNAAHITNGNTDVKIYGGNKIGNVFGGGNGTVTAANVSGNTNVNIYGGTIGRVFGGSNSAGNIGGTINVNVSKSGSCAMHIDEVYGGGNMAASNAGNLTIGCTGGNGEGIGDVYGGANQADITGNVSLSITGGRINRVFGGNNQSGSISGTIEVEVNWDSSLNCGNDSLGSVFGGGNQAVYTAPTGSTNYPLVNILNGTVSGDVFGGGYGNASDATKGVVNGNPRVNINGANAVVNGGVYGGGSLAPTVGNPVVTLTNGSAAKLFGGGKAAGITGAPTVNINGGTVTAGVYGGCDASGTVSGNIVVNVTGGTVGSSTTKAEGIFGGGFGEATATSGNVEVNIGTSGQTTGGATIYGDVYGGSALGSVNGTSVDASKHTYVNLNKGTIHGDAYGGGLGRQASSGVSAVAGDGDAERCGLCHDHYSR